MNEGKRKDGGIKGIGEEGRLGEGEEKG